MNWKSYREETENKDIEGKSWASDRESLLKIFHDLELLSVKPPAKKISFSNQRTLIKFLRKAIASLNEEKINDLLQAGAKLTNRDLRLYLGSANVEEIEVIQLPNTPLPKYQIILNQEQLDTLIASTKTNFDFQIVKK